jgi:hypothetical protein
MGDGPCTFPRSLHGTSKNLILTHSEDRSDYVLAWIILTRTFTLPRFIRFRERDPNDRIFGALDYAKVALIIECAGHLLHFRVSR